MKAIKTEIPGVVLLEPEVFGDARGYFMERFSQRRFDELVGPLRFVQDNESKSRYGVVRGLHFQKGEYAQAKLVSVVRGRVLDVAVDIRRGSPTFGRHVAALLDGENKRQLFIPRGFAHGFAVLSDEAVFQYKCPRQRGRHCVGRPRARDRLAASGRRNTPLGERPPAPAAGRRTGTFRIRQTMNILVTGANGQLGREIQRLSAVSPNNYTFTDVAELNVTDAGAVRQAVAQTRAEVIVNCAAYTNVERAEEDEEAADRLNRGAAENLARAAEANGATLIHVSTDYVFDGTAHLPYTEDAPTAPLGVYGRTKLAGERAVAESGCKYLTFRTAWLYSEYGNNFLKTMLRLTAEKERLNVVFDQAGTPTYARDLAMTIFSIVEGGYFAGNEGLYHFSNEGVASWYDFAAEIAAAAGHDKCRIRPCRTAEFPTKAARPAYSVLDKSKIKETFGLEIPHWRESMLYCLKNMLR